VATPQNIVTHRGGCSTPARRQHAHHERGRVRAADEEQRHEHDHHERRQARERELLQRREEPDLRRLGDRGGDVGAAELEVDRRAADDGEPHERHAGRDREHAEDDSPTVRPFEMRAMNVPTKGAQEIHHAR
jgi:hypothetical protein